MKDDKPNLEKELENVFTIDGRGRPAKAKFFLQLIDTYGMEAVLETIKKLGERKFF